MQKLESRKVVELSEAQLGLVAGGGTSGGSCGRPCSSGGDNNGNGNGILNILNGSLNGNSVNVLSGIGFGNAVGNFL